MRFAVGMVLALALFGTASAETLKVDLPPPAVVPALEAGAQVAPVSLSRMAASLADGEPYAIWRLAWICNGPGTLFRWNSEMNDFSDPEFERIFREELSQASFKVSGDPTNLFERDTKASDLQVGVMITDMKLSICPLATGYSGFGTLDAEWQIYSTSAGRLVGRISTRGGVQAPKTKESDEMLAQLLKLSFAENVRQLAANPEFRRIVLNPAASPQAPAAPPGPLRAAFPAPGKPVPLKDAASGAVVVFAGAGSGSGVLISPDGYILTNHHVTGDSGRVRVRWADGTDALGEVVRADRRRDVALIKVAAPKGRPLAIRRTPVELGETVFAIGTPLDPSLQNTVTKGVVSALRMVEGQSFIQSDTPVTHGNSGGPLLDEAGAVVGLTDLGLDPAAGSTINFFIPINDALKVLALQPAA